MTLPLNSREESGFVDLAAGQVEADVDFTYTKTAREYRFTHLYVEKIGDANPISIQAVPFNRTVTGFKVALSAAAAVGHTLQWGVKVA
jgi:hypothetical protein